MCASKSFRALFVPILSSRFDWDQSDAKHLPFAARNLATLDQDPFPFSDCICERVTYNATNSTDPLKKNITYTRKWNGSSHKSDLKKTNPRYLVKRLWWFSSSPCLILPQMVAKGRSQFSDFCKQHLRRNNAKDPRSFQFAGCRFGGSNSGPRWSSDQDLPASFGPDGWRKPRMGAFTYGSVWSCNMVKLDNTKKIKRIWEIKIRKNGMGPEINPKKVHADDTVEQEWEGKWVV